MSVLGSDQISSNILDLKHSKIATNIPGGLLMVFSAFLMLSKILPEVNNVIIPCIESSLEFWENYNEEEEAANGAN